MGKLQAASYNDQLLYLENMIRLSGIKGGAAIAVNNGNLHMLLSIAQSIKDARDHNLNCPPTHGALAFNRGGNDVPARKL